jgi:hypothetical protein
MAKVKKSAVFAFVELLNSVANEEEVLLLRSSDRNANEALHIYNDTIHEDGEADPIYLGFLDRLAEKFIAAAEGAGKSQAGDLRPEDMKHFGAMLLQITNKATATEG